MKKIINLKNNILRNIFFFFFLIIPLFLSPFKVSAEVSKTELNGEMINASSEFLRDLDYETWQLVAYRSSMNENKLVLRLIGYPGSLRIDHPLNLNVQSGRKAWLLEDVTQLNEMLLNDKRQAAVEFDLEELVQGITQNRPLRLSLPGVFSELPVPPFLVKEWRSIN